MHGPLLLEFQPWHDPLIPTRSSMLFPQSLQTSSRFYLYLQRNVFEIEYISTQGPIHICRPSFWKFSTPFAEFINSLSLTAKTFRWHLARYQAWLVSKPVSTECVTSYVFGSVAPNSRQNPTQACRIVLTATYVPGPFFQLLYQASLQQHLVVGT